MPLDTNLLFQVMSIQSATRNQQAMSTYLQKQVLRFGATSVETDRHGNIYVTKTATPDASYPTLVAHMDTVHRILPPDQFSIISHHGTWFAYNPVKREPTGIGGDDKVGIFIALTALDHFDHIKVVFFVDEEIGCQGSAYADMSFFDDSAYVIQCDRKGYGDVVQDIFGTALFGTEFLNAIQPLMTAYGMKATPGGLTDVYELKERGLDVATTNISCGYYLPHTHDEFLLLTDVFDTTSFVLDVVQELGLTRYAHTPPPARFTSNWKSWKSWEDDPKPLPKQHPLPMLPAKIKEDWFCYDCINYAGQCTCDVATSPFCPQCRAFNGLCNCAAYLEDRLDTFA